jgi:hypothetical protein
VVVFAAGALVVAGVLSSAIRTVVLPRGVSGRLARTVFVGLRIALKLVIHRSTTYERRDAILSAYAPLSLLALLTTWLLGILAGFTAMFWATGVHPLRAAYAESGSSMFTLGFARPRDLPTTTLAFADAGLGLLLLALLITFLPTIYAALQSRESTVARLEVRAGSPPSGVTILARMARLNRLDYRAEIWAEWEQWFVAVEQSHTQFTILPYFRSPQPDQSWVTAAGAVLDGCSLAASCLDDEPDLRAQLTIRAGYVALRRIASLFKLPHDADPAPHDPIAVSREEFDEAWDTMAAAGVPLKTDRHQAWRDFAGWRVTYDTVLIRLANLTEAPMAPWSSDRGLIGDRPLTFMERIRQ